MYYIVIYMDSYKYLFLESVCYCSDSSRIVLDQTFFISKLVGVYHTI